MRILLSNDDGVHAPGLSALAAAFPGDEVWVVAPDREQSASSHSISLHRPLRVVEVEPRRYAVDGTPTDAVYMGMNLVLRDKRPDVVVSGVNHGPNLASDVLYSGTVAAAMEGALLGCPAIAVSLAAPAPHAPEDLARAAVFAAAVAREVVRRQPPAPVLINVNVPAGPVPRLPLRAAGPAHLRQRGEGEAATRAAAPTTGSAATPVNEDVPGSDCNSVFQDGLASVTPLHLDWTHDALLDDMRSWTIDGLPQGALLLTRPPPSHALGLVVAAGAVLAVAACAHHEAPWEPGPTARPAPAPRPQPPRPPEAPAPPVPLPGPERHLEPDVAGAFHEVKKGETLYRIARTYGIPLRELMEVNGICATRVSSRWACASSCPTPPATWRSRRSPARRRRRRGARRPRRRQRPRPHAPAPPCAGRCAACSTAASACGRASATTASTSPPPRAPTWRAAAPGTVVYTGQQSGYGSIVIVRHDRKDLLTLYAHASAILVRTGDRVEAGQPIARVGQTGRTTGPHLHFEVREGTRARNPLLYLP